MRAVLIGCLAAALVGFLSACGGGSSTSSTSAQEAQRQADLYQIDQIERNWHKALSRHDIGLMMSLWAPKATFTIPGQTLSGTAQIRKFWLTQTPLGDPKVHWVLDTPAYKIRETANGDRGTLYFECDHIDLKTRKVIAVTAADIQVAKMAGRWLITDNVGSTPKLEP